MTLLALILIPVIALFLRFMRPRVERLTRAVRQRSSDLTSLFVETLGAVKFIQSVGAEAREAAQLKALQDAFRQDTLRLQMTSYVTATVPGAITAVSTAMVFIVGGHMAIQGNLTVGTLIAFSAYLVRATGPIHTLLGLYVAVQRARVSLQRVADVRDAPRQVEEPVKDVRSTAGLTGEIVFDHVSFAHRSQDPVLRDVSLSIPAGSKVAVQGASGSGKTTFSDLLQRHYDPREGVVRIDNVDLRRIPLAELRRRIAVVAQETVLFSGSIADNVRYANPDADAEALDDAVERAHVSEFAARLPQGLATSVGMRGRALSGGQRQRIAIASIWGGEEGTLLLLAALMAVMAIRLLRHPGWAAPVALLFAAGFTAGAIVWNPFAATPADLLYNMPRGMNVHLMSIWMALHPPLIFVAYVLILAPVGAALQELATGSGSWPILASRYMRAGWLLLSTGVAFGMWWAFEDFTFGQVWHWDPVQPSVFVVWALCTAQLHGLGCFRSDGPFRRTLPLLAVVTTAAVLGAMVVTRNQELASSHRYVGSTSAPWLLAMAVITILAGAVAGIRSLPRPSARRSEGVERIWLLHMAVGLFTVMAVIGIAGLVYALAGAYLHWERPDWAKPFFETVARWSAATELPALENAFSQWNVNGFAVNQWLAPVAALTMLIGGHTFLGSRSRPLAWSLTLGTAATAIVVALYLNPMQSLYAGTGVTSQQTVGIFFWLDVLSLAALYFFGSVSAWVLGAVFRRSRQIVYRLSVGLVHGGVVIALLALMVSMVLDSYVQTVLESPVELTRLQSLADGYGIKVDFVDASFESDGGRRGAEPPYRAIAAVNVEMLRNGTESQEFSGNTVYRVQSEPLETDPGPVRQLCQILDYRYARYASGPGYILHPFINRGRIRTEQVWVSPRFEQREQGAPADVELRPMGATVVIRTFPLLSWLWVGLLMALLGAGIAAVRAWTGRPPSIRARMK